MEVHLGVKMADTLSFTAKVDMVDFWAYGIQRVSQNDQAKCEVVGAPLELVITFEIYRNTIEKDKKKYKKEK